MKARSGEGAVEEIAEMTCGVGRWVQKAALTLEAFSAGGILQFK